MKKIFVLLLLTSSAAIAQNKLYPAIKSGGGMFEVPEQAPIVDKKMKYKIVMDIHEGSPKPDSANAGLDKMARLINLYVDAGVPKENIDISAVFHFTATPVILTDEAYQTKFGVNNPNTKLLNEMAAWGAKFYVCGQSLRARKFVDTPKNKNITVVSAAMVYLSMMQLKNYAIINP